MVVKIIFDVIFSEHIFLPYSINFLGIFGTEFFVFIVVGSPSYLSNGSDVLRWKWMVGVNGNDIKLVLDNILEKLQFPVN